MHASKVIDIWNNRSVNIPPLRFGPASRRRTGTGPGSQVKTLFLRRLRKADRTAPSRRESVRERAAESLTAIHRAGHAVALLAHGHRFRFLAPDSCAGAGGNSPEEFSRNVIALAGPVAQLMASRPAGLPDAAMVQQVLRHLDTGNPALCRFGNPAGPDPDQLAVALAIISAGWDDALRIAAALTDAAAPLTYPQTLAVVEHSHGVNIGPHFDRWQKACAPTEGSLRPAALVS